MQGCPYPFSRYSCIVLW